MMIHVRTRAAWARRLMLLALLVLLPAALLNADSFTEFAQQWADFFCLEDERCNVGDFNGDDRDDVIAFVRGDADSGQAGDVYVSLSDGSSFGAQGDQWAELFCLADEVCGVGDFNGDGNDDVVAFVRGDAGSGQEGDVYVSLSNGSSFAAQGDQWAELFCLGNEVCATGDFNGDGFDDVIAFVQDTQSGGQAGDVYVSLSDGSSFGAQGDQWAERFCLEDAVCRVGDVNGDGNDDIVSFVRDSAAGEEGTVYVALSNGANGFGARTLWNELFCIGDETCRVGDFNGDGVDDILAYVRDTQTGADRGDVYVALSDATAFVDPSIWQRLFCLENETCRVGDFNGDGRADGVAFVGAQDTGEERGDVYVVLSREEDLPRPPEFDETLFLPFVVR